MFQTAYNELSEKLTSLDIIPAKKEAIEKTLDGLIKYNVSKLVAIEHDYANDRFLVNRNLASRLLIVLGEEKPNTKNIPVVDSPVEVTKTTKITNPDGTTRTVDIDRSSYYESNGKIYKLDLDASGYVITQGEMKALLRKTSTNSYIFKSDNKTAIGYFDTEGNLVIEFYDDKLDIVNIEKYAVIKK